MGHGNSGVRISRHDRHDSTGVGQERRLTGQGGCLAGIRVFLAVNAVQPEALAFAVVQHGEVAPSHRLARLPVKSEVIAKVQGSRRGELSELADFFGGPSRD